MTVTAKNDKRLSICIPSDVMDDIKRFKREKYYDVTYTAMYRDLIRLGVEAAKAKEAGE